MHLRLPPRNLQRTHVNRTHARGRNRTCKSGSNRCVSPTRCHAKLKREYLRLPRMESCSRDPIGYVDGPNSYAAYFAPDYVDPLGLWTLPLMPWWDNGDWVDHYYTGNNRPIDLGDIGLLDDYLAVHEGERNQVMNSITSGAAMPSCSSEGSFSANETSSGSRNFNSIPSCDNRYDGLILDPLYAVGCSTPTYSYNVTKSWTCTKCCDGSLKITSFSTTGTVDYNLSDYFTNPNDNGGASDGGPGIEPHLQCTDSCWATYRSCASGARGSSIRLCSRARERCLSQCRRDHPTNDYGRPYRITANWSESVSDSWTDSCD